MYIGWYNEAELEQELIRLAGLDPAHFDLGVSKENQIAACQLRLNAVQCKKLFAVKRFEQGNWVYVAIFRSMASARQYTKMPKSDYPLVKDKIVHPTKHIVDAYLTLRNIIRE